MKLDLEEFIQDYKSEKVSYILNKYKISSRTIYNILRRNNITFKRFPSKTFSKEDFKQITNEYLNYPLDYILDKHKISTNVLYRSLKNRGVKLRGQGYRLKTQQDSLRVLLHNKFLKMKACRKTKSFIMRELNINEKTYIYLRKLK